MRHHEFLSEDELFEINMSPSNLTKLVKAIPGAKVGLEFEMIVPGAQVNDDENGENDYDQDERTRSFDNIYNFFNGGDGNNSRRDVQNLINDLQEQYHDYAGERRWEDWNENGFDFFKEYIEDDFDEEDALEEAKEEIAEANPEMIQDSEEFNELVSERVEEKKDEWFQSEWERQGSNWEHARESWEESEDYPDEDDWLDDNGYRYMSDVERLARDHDVYWPYTVQNDSEADVASVAQEFGDAVGRPVEYATGYHGINRGNQESQGFYIVEPDGSLDPDEPSDEVGLEFVSPPVPVEQMMDEIRKVAAWAETRGAYTGKSNKTGLHMNVSVPNYDKDKLDFVKLALLLGDNHVLKEFDRMSYHYAKSSFDLLSSKIKNNPDMAEKGLAAMKNHFNIAASKAIHSGNTDKFTSINVKDNRVEFRGPGGDYLQMFASNPNKLFAPMMRFVVALEAACDPEKYKEEYQKKLYKFLSSAVKSKDTLSLFTDYAAGKGIPQSAYKSFLRHRSQERELKRPGEGITVAGRRSNPDGDWALFRRHPTGDYNKPYDVEVLYRFNASGNSDADIVRDQFVQEHNPSFQVMISSDPEKKYGQPGDYKSAEKSQDGSGDANWGVYRTSDNQRMKYNGNYVRYDDMSKDEAQEQLRLLFRNAHTATAIDDYELRKLSKYEIYVKNGGQVVNGTDGNPLHFDASTYQEAEKRFPQILADFNIGNPDDYDVRSVLNVPQHTVTTQPARTATGSPQATAANGVPMWTIYRISDGEVVHNFAEHPSQHSRTALAWLRDNGHTENPQFNFRVRAMSQDEYSRERDPTAVQATPPQNSTGNWGIWITSSNRFVRAPGQLDNSVLRRFPDREAAEQFIVQTRQDRPDMRSDIEVREIEPTQQPTQQQQPARGGFTGEWKIVDAVGQELHRFGGVGNVQADANRVAAQWIQNNPSVVYSGGLSVLPIMGNQ